MKYYHHNKKVKEKKEELQGKEMKPKIKLNKKEGKKYINKALLVTKSWYR